MQTNPNSRMRATWRFLSGSTAGRLVSLAAVTAIATGVYMTMTVGGPGQGTPAVPLSADKGNPMPGASAGPVRLSGFDSQALSAGEGEMGLVMYGAAAQPLVGDGTSAAADQTLIVKTGSCSLEVSSVENAVGQAKATIAGMGGYVAESQQYGSGDDLTATVTYRLPAARWDDALSAMHKLGKVLSEQTGTSNVTAQVVDLDARINNLKTTETALQGIMAKASAIPDILSVQNQLTLTRSEIEQLTAQRDYLSDQAAMSTLSVSFQLPTKTVVTTTAEEWNLGQEIDKAVAQLIKVGQGLATVAIWAIVVGVPVALGLLILIGILWLIVRIFGRMRRSPNPQAPATPA
jgi:hypothetical protein